MALVRVRSQRSIMGWILCTRVMVRLAVICDCGSGLVWRMCSAQKPAIRVADVTRVYVTGTRSVRGMSGKSAA